MGALLSSACGDSGSNHPANAISIGAILPFTGMESAVGRNLEQALLLAVEDVNKAGGVAGRPFDLISRDSNSGTERGFQELLQLLYTDEVAYLIGPEENDLASKIVPDIKAKNVFNILPGFSAPSISRTSPQGAWLRLAPDPLSIGCAMAHHAIAEGVQTVNTLAANDDFNSNLASSFKALIVNLGGTAQASVTLHAGAPSYADKISQAFGVGVNKTMLIAYPATAATVVTEWSIADRRGSWYLSPMLRADVLLLNIPAGVLNGQFGMSPTLSLRSECVDFQDGVTGPVTCTRTNTQQFSDHFAARWEGDRPLPVAQFYYDSVVLLAMAMQYGVAKTGSLPAASALHRLVGEMNKPDRAPASWHDLGTALPQLGAGTPMRYIGAAAEYEFDPYGAAEHHIFDMWTIGNGRFVDIGSFAAFCVKML